MPRITVADFEITPTAASKFWSHGIDAEHVSAVLDHPRIVIHNRRGRAAPYVPLGRDE